MVAGGCSNAKTYVHLNPFNTSNICAHDNYTQGNLLNFTSLAPRGLRELEGTLHIQCPTAYENKQKITGIILVSS